MAVVAVVATLAGTFVALVSASPAAAIPGGDITQVCTGTTDGTTFTLTDDCGPVETPLTVPPGITTVDGGGEFTISATDSANAQWHGGIVTNETAGQTMNIQNVTISGPEAGFVISTISTNVLYGIWFNDAGGSVSNVIVDHIWQQPNPQSPSNQTGRAIRADAVSAERTVTISDGTEVRDYQKSGFEARSLGALMTMDLSGSTAGPPHALPGFIAQNAVSYVGAAGTIAGNEIIGSGDQYGPPDGGGNGTAILLSGANNVTVDQNIITGTNTDIGVSVSANSNNITISFNEIGRTVEDDYADPTGIGIDVDHPTSSATLICNTFSSWNQNISGAVQISCTELPDGTECEPYTGDVLAVEGGTAPFTWSVAEGTLPPGLTMAADSGVITGTPTAAGTFDFTVQVVDATEPSLTATQPQTITIAPGCVTTTTSPPTTSPPTTSPPTTSPPPPSTVTPVTTDPPATLPATGNDLTELLYVGLALLALGSLVVIIARRRASGS